VVWFGEGWIGGPITTNTKDVATTQKRKIHHGTHTGEGSRPVDTYRRTYVYTCTDAYTRTDTYIYIHTQTHTQTHTRTYRMYVCVHTNPQAKLAGQLMMTQVPSGNEGVRRPTS
jgi:DNA gyrase inhibitor GyrI